jgi:hypothetical protein
LFRISKVVPGDCAVSTVNENTDNSTATTAEDDKDAKQKQAEQTEHAAATKKPKGTNMRARRTQKF